MRVQACRLLLTLICSCLVLALAAGPALGEEGTVNINTATVAQFELLPRVGPAVASRIVEFREQNGRFKNAEDLLLVRGIGDRTFDLLEKYLAVEGKTTLTEKISVPKQSRKVSSEAAGSSGSQKSPAPSRQSAGGSGSSGA